jgi:hypothetical protein
VEFGEAHVKQTEAAHAEQVRQRPHTHLARRAVELGYELKIEEERVTQGEAVVLLADCSSSNPVRPVVLQASALPAMGLAHHPPT